MVNGVVGGAVVEVDRRESESKGCDVFYPSTLFIPSVWLPQLSTRTCCGASIEVATVLPHQGRLNQKATLIRPFHCP
jgi:hypothetical protein